MFSLSAANIIQEFSQPYQNVGLINFMHDITFGKNQISMLVSNKEIFLFYHRNQIPMLCTNDFGRTLQNGIYINKTLETQYQDCQILLPLMVRVGQQFDHCFGKNSLHIIVRENECQHMYSLFFNLSEMDFLHWVINNGSLLNDLLASYNLKANDIILEAKLPTNRIVLPNFNPDISHNHHSKLISLIHKRLNRPIYLSSQQSKCLTILMKGKSAKEIAIEMKLSHRTIEHYIASLKEILGCTSSKDLITSYYDQMNVTISQ